MELFKPGTQSTTSWVSGVLDRAQPHRSSSSRSILVFYPGPNYGTDFQGGTEIEVAFKQADRRRRRSAHAVETSRLLRRPTSCRSSTPTNPNHFLIRVQEVSAIDDDEQGRAPTKALCLVEDGERR